MTPAALLSSLESRGVAARIDGGELRLRPALGPDARVLAEVRAMKLPLMALLRERETREYSRAAATVAEKRDFNAGAVFSRAEAEEYAHAAFARSEVTEAQRDALLWYARAASTRADISLAAAK
jgi:hypothetical protein